MAGQHHSDPTKLKNLAVTVMTAVLAKSVRFLEHVSLVQGVVPVSRVSCRYPGPRESVHIKLLVCPVSFSHNNVRLLMVYRPYAVCLPCDLPVQSQTDRQTDRIVNYTVTLAAHAREG